MCLSSHMHQSLLNNNSIINTGRPSLNAAAGFICMYLICQRIKILDGMRIVNQLICERNKFQRVLGVAPTNHNFS